MKAGPMPALAAVIVAAVASGAAVAEGTQAAATGEDSWSEAVNGLQARIILKRSRVINGTPIISTFLALRNVSDVMNPLTIPWNHKLVKFRVLDAAGNELPIATGPYSGMELFGTMNLVLPIRGELSFDYSHSGLGIPGDKAALICLGSKSSWVIEPNQGDYVLHAVLEVEQSSPVRDEATRPWRGRIELPPVRIPQQAEPLDDATIEARIRHWGPKMLDGDQRVAEEAERILSLIDDPRVIEWYLKALETNSYALKARATDRLSRFDNDEAFGGLKKAIGTRAADFGDTASARAAPQLADNIRHSAAVALARSPHPEARQTLLTMWSDPYRGVRITVLHALGKMDSPESLALLKKMSTDREELVRDEALRYLKRREENAD